MFVDEFLLFAFNVMILNPISLSKFDQTAEAVPIGSKCGHENSPRNRACADCGAKAPRWARWHSFVKAAGFLGTENFYG